MFFEKLLSYPRKYQKKNVFLENFQQYKLIDKFPLGGSHPFFIDPFRKIYLETFLSLKIVKGLTFTHNINNTLQVDSKNSYSQSALSLFLLNVNQSIIETHPHFYDPIGIQLERKFHKNKISRKTLTIVAHSNFTFNSAGKILLLLFIVEMYICPAIKMRKWLQWKFHYT